MAVKSRGLDALGGDKFSKKIQSAEGGALVSKGGAEMAQSAATIRQRDW